MTDEQPKIFVVSSGDYSDYGIRGIFSTREKADDYKRKWDLVNSEYNGATVEEWDIDPERPEPVLMYEVNVHGAEFDNPKYTPQQEPDYLRDYASSLVTYHEPNHRERWHRGWGGSAFGETPEQALKIAYDLVSKKKAEILGL